MSCAAPMKKLFWKLYWAKPEVFLNPGLWIYLWGKNRRLIAMRKWIEPPC